MGNDVSVFGGKVNVADVKGLAAKAKEAAQNNPRGGGPAGSDYLNFSGKKGIFTIGVDNRQIENDELWIVDVTSFEEGWICWKGGKPASTRLSNIYSGLPVMAPNPEDGGPFNQSKGEGWFQAKAMVLKSLEHDQQGYLKLNSISGVSSMAELIGAFADRAVSTEEVWPVIRLDVEEFEAQGFKNYKPVFDVVGWLTAEQLQEVAEGADVGDFLELEDEPEPEPVKPAPKAITGRRRG